MSYRGLSLSEAWRLSGRPLGFLAALGFKLVAKKGNLCRLPPSAVERECPASAIDGTIHRAFLDAVTVAQTLGYGEGRTYTLVETHDPAQMDGFSYIGLHRDHRRGIFIAALRRRSASGISLTQVTSGGLRTVAGVDLDFTDHRKYLDVPGPSKKVVVEGSGVAVVHEAMERFLQKGEAIPFDDFAALKRHANLVADRAFDARIARGLFALEKSDPSAPP